MDTEITLRLSFPDLVRLHKILLCMQVCVNAPQEWGLVAGRVADALEDQVDCRCAYPGEPDPPFSDMAMHVGRLVAAEKKAWVLSLPEPVTCHLCGIRKEAQTTPWTCIDCCKESGTA